jgi:hypothetical protein
MQLRRFLCCWRGVIVQTWVQDGAQGGFPCVQPSEWPTIISERVQPCIQQEHEIQIVPPSHTRNAKVILILQSFPPTEFAKGIL